MPSRAARRVRLITTQVSYGDPHPCPCHFGVGLPSDGTPEDLFDYVITHLQFCAHAGHTTGSENNSRRTQFIKRMIEFADKHSIQVRLAYYPPYHSKYNPIERCWGALVLLCQICRNATLRNLV